MNALREFSDGRLKVTSDATFGDLLPPYPTELIGHVTPTPMIFAGDDRADEHAGLEAMHTLWMREHNYWAGILKRYRPNWNDDQLYWKARELVVAEMQVITYNEWLPALLGTAYELNDNLNSVEFQAAGDVNPLLSEFSIVAFRLGHSMVTDRLGDFSLVELFSNKNFIKEKGLEVIFEAAKATPAQKVDDKVVYSLRNILFGDFGMDLVSMNIFRARHMQVARYGEMVNCMRGIVDLGSDEFKREWDPLLAILQEPHLTGSSVGPTLAVFLNKQFDLLRKNDLRFYLWSKESIGSRFYDIVTKVTLKDIIARNTKYNAIKYIKGNTFFL